MWIIKNFGVLHYLVVTLCNTLTQEDIQKASKHPDLVTKILLEIGCYLQ